MLVDRAAFAHEVLEQPRAGVARADEDEHPAARGLRGREERLDGVAAGSLTVLHLILLSVLAAKGKEYSGGLVADPAGPAAHRGLVPTRLDAVTYYLTVLIYAPKGASLGGEGILFLLAAACELARCILVCLTIRGQATAAKDYDAADKAGMGVMLSSIVTGAAAALVTVLVVIVIEGKMIKSAEYLAGLGGAAVCTGYALMTVPAALAALAASQSLGRKARRGG